jgi:hypothetical protein
MKINRYLNARYKIFLINKITRRKTAGKKKNIYVNRIKKTTGAGIPC